jgi:hypothetical protein
MADDKKRYRRYEWFGKPDRDDFLTGASGAPIPTGFSLKQALFAW